MKRSLYLLVVSVLVTSIVPAACGDDGGWRLPNLNPFSGKSKPPVTQRAGNPATSGWKMPNLWPQTTARAKKKPNQQSTWSRMSNGTTSFLSKTADALTPWDNDKPAATPPKLTGSNSIFTQNGATRGNAQKSSSVSPASWWSSDKPDQPDKSVNDFLSRPRPQ